MPVSVDNTGSIYAGGSFGVAQLNKHSDLSIVTSPQAIPIMIQIEQANLLIKKTLSERVYPDPEKQVKSLDRIISDFDFTSYHVSTLENRLLILLSVYLQCWGDLTKYGVEQSLKSKYSKYSQFVSILDDVEAGFNFSMVVDTEALSGQDEETKQEAIEQLSLLKRNCIAAAFETAFARYDELSAHYQNLNTYAEEIQAELQKEPVLVVNYRGVDESIYIKPSFDRVTVIFSTIFKDETDKIFGKVFLQEFVDARKRSVQTAPQVMYSHKDAPLDIQSAVTRRQNDENKGYVTFVLFPRHLVKGERRENCISHVQFFRNYFHYHIKCSKAYMHTRMRHRVREFLKVLNRAKPENVDDDGNAVDNRRTATGRKFEVGRV